MASTPFNIREAKQSGSIATPDNVYSQVSNRSVSRTGNIVTIHFVANIASGKTIAGSNGLIATLPAGFRPSENMALTIISTYNGTYASYDAILHSDGTITTATGANTFSTGMRIDATLQY